MTWAITADVLSLTGASATSAQLLQAEGVIEIYANRTAAASGDMGPRDLNWMKIATCWQAAWQSQQPGYEVRNQAQAVMQDGMQVQRETEWSVTLAPLAGRALKNLSWKGSRSLRMPNARVPSGLAIDFTQEESDWSTHWEPLEGVG